MQLHPDWHNNSAPSPPEWVVWDYTPAEWAAFDATEWGRAEQAWRLRIKLACLVAAGVLGLILLLLLIDANLGVFLLVILGGFAVIALLTNSSSVVYQRALTRHKARRRGPAQVRLSPSGVTFGTDYIPFNGPGNLFSNEASLALHWVRFVAGPPARLVFLLVYGSGGRDEVAVPVGTGAHDTAIALVARYKREVIRRRPTLSPQPNALPSRPLRPAVPAPSLPTDHPTQRLPTFDPNPLQLIHPTQRLPRQWVGGTPTAQRYGFPSAGPDERVAPPVFDSDTQRLPPDGAP